MSDKKRSIIFAIVIILIAAVIALFGAMRPMGGAAIVSVADGETIKLPLDKDGTFLIKGGKLPVNIEIKDGKARFINSVCPDHICEGFGWLSKEQDKATCAPARVVLSIEE